MYRNILIGTFAAILVVAIGTAAFNIVDAQAQGALAAPAAGNGYGQGGTQANPQAPAGVQNHAIALADIPASDLSAEETAALLYMYEEEKTGARCLQHPVCHLEHSHLPEHRRQ